MPCWSLRAASGLVIVAGVAMTMQACGGGGSAPSSSAVVGGDDDAGPTPDAGAPTPEAAAYPAVSPSLPSVQSAGGAILPAPRVVPVFFPGETQSAMFTDFLGKYLASREWRAATAEYGVGAATLADAVQSTDVPPQDLRSADLGMWLAAHLDGTHPGWGPTDDATIASSIYLLYPPAGTTVFAPEQDPSNPMSQSLCGPHAWDLEGWHWQTTPAPGPAPAIAFALVGACTDYGVSLADRMTATTAHELAEAVTDPLFVTSPAYSSVDDAHAFWMELTGGGEIGDLCAQDPADLVTPPDVGYAVQRIWSNAAAAAGHDPCVPSIAPTYFNVRADAPDAFYDPYADTTVQGVQIPSGQSRTIDVHLVADGPTAPWKVTAVDPNQAAGGRSLLKMTLDHDSGANSDVLHLTIEPLFQGKGVTALYEIDSTLQGRTQRWYGEIAVR